MLCRVEPCSGNRTAVDNIALPSMLKPETNLSVEVNRQGLCSSIPSRPFSFRRFYLRKNNKPDSTRLGGAFSEHEGEGAS